MTDRAIQMEENRLSSKHYNATFASYVTSTAFDLRLTKTMIAYLCEVHFREKHNRSSRVHRLIGAPDNFIATLNALLRRGLIEQFDKDMPGHTRLTPAGRHVLGLLIIAGLADEDMEDAWLESAGNDVFRKDWEGE